MDTKDASGPEIEWFRTAYVVAEDRLRLSCALVGGGSDTLWLTHRLARAMVEKLVDWLNQTTRHSGVSDIAHLAAQQSAVAKSPKRRAEQIAETPGWLVHAIDFRSLPTGLMLTFKDKERSLRLRFGARHLRQWLNVVHVQYRRSGWPADIWPDWIAEIAEDGAEGRPGLLH